VVPSDDVQIEVDNCTFKTTQWQQQNNSNKIKQKHNQAKINSWKLDCLIDLLIDWLIDQMGDLSVMFVANHDMVYIGQLFYIVNDA
jgi:hypothetical protein